jgi:SAM-dependent methyltransferase
MEMEARQGMKHFYEQIDGWFNFKEIYDSALAQARDGDVFVEVGSWYGRSAAYMAVEIANSGKQIDFYCVDTWAGSRDSPWMADHLAPKGGSALPFFEENMRAGGVLERIKIIQRPSVIAASAFQPESIDFVMIDGAHDYASVREDVRAWISKVKPGGVIAGDDSNWPGVLVGTYETIPFSEVEILNHGANWRHRKERPARGSWTVRRRTPSADYLAYIPYVNRPDLLDAAVASIPDLWRSLIVIDQSEDPLKSSDHPWMEKIAGVFRSRPGDMIFSQMMNWAQAEAFNRGKKYLVFMHNDAECQAGLPREVLDYARIHPRSGVVFTHYDALAVFNMEAVRDTGPWDETFRWYFSDNDYYRRLRLRNWDCSDFGGERVVHHGSQTHKSAPQISAEVQVHWQWHQDHYRHKWGGAPGEEKYSIPYNGQP